KTSFTCSDVGANTVTLTVTDNNGNESSATATVTVEDNVDPVAIAQDITIQLDANGNASITAAQIDNGSNDACGIKSLVLDKTSFNCANVGENNITLTVTDNKGNVSTAMAIITVVDDILPTIIAPANITISTDLNECSASNVDLGIPTTNDKCGVRDVSNDAPTNFPVGVTTV